MAPVCRAVMRLYCPNRKPISRPPAPRGVRSDHGHKVAGRTRRAAIEGGGTFSLLAGRNAQPRASGSNTELLPLRACCGERRGRWFDRPAGPTHPLRCRPLARRLRSRCDGTTPSSGQGWGGMHWLEGGGPGRWRCCSQRHRFLAISARTRVGTRKIAGQSCVRAAPSPEILPACLARALARA